MNLLKLMKKEANTRIKKCFQIFLKIKYDEEDRVENIFGVDGAARKAYVESYHYIDDKRYALSYILSQKEKKGKARIQMELRRKGVSQEDIDQAFAETEEETDETG